MKTTDVLWNVLSRLLRKNTMHGVFVYIKGWHVTLADSFGGTEVQTEENFCSTGRSL